MASFQRGERQVVVDLTDENAARHRQKRRGLETAPFR